MLRVPMSRIIVCQHVAYEILGTLHPLIKEAGLRLRYVNFERDPGARPTLDGYDGLVVLGGPMNVDQTEEFPFLATEVELVGEAVARDMPVLGICLGGQLVARAFGARVYDQGTFDFGFGAARVDTDTRLWTVQLDGTHGQPQCPGPGGNVVDAPQAFGGLHQRIGLLIGKALDPNSRGHYLGGDDGALR